MSCKLKLEEVAYFSHEHSRNTVKQLLLGAGKWTSPVNSRIDVMEAEISLPEPKMIFGVDVGNFWSASIEVQVGLSDWPQSKREVLLKEQIFMNRLDCSLGDNKQKMMFFREQHFNKDVSCKKWDRIKIICRQPFKINNDTFGLAMFVLHGVKEAAPETQITSKENDKKVTDLTSSKNGLEDFKKRASSMLNSPKSPYVPSVLKNLENTKKQGDSEADNNSSKSNTNFSVKSMSRTAKLVVKGQDKTGKTLSFADEAKQFLLSCEFDKKSFAEIENITFRNVKMLWAEKKKCELNPTEKAHLKQISTAFLTKLVNRSSKRQREASDENSPPKKRKISKQIESMRKGTDIDDFYDNDAGSNMRNKIAVSDVKKKVEEDDEDITAIKKKFKVQNKSTPIVRSPKTQKKKDEVKDLPTFDLTSSPEISPIKMKSPKNDGMASPKDNKHIDDNLEAVFDLTLSPLTSPVKLETKKARTELDTEVQKEDKPAVDDTKQAEPVLKNRPVVPHYNRKHLLSVSHDVLTDSGVLVQVYNYKKDKKLPLKGNLELSAQKGTPVTFFKVGPDIHLEYQGRFYLPDIEAEHLDRVFKNFKHSQIHCSVYPSKLESILKDSSRKQIEEKDQSKVVPTNCDSIPGFSKDQKKKEDDVDDFYDDLEKPSKIASEVPNKLDPQGVCPLCQGSFSIQSLEAHAAECNGPDSDNAKGMSKCPICDLEVESDALEDHANTCASSRFGI